MHRATHDGVGWLIQGLSYQVPFELIPKHKGERVVSYVANFVYTENDQQMENAVCRLIELEGGLDKEIDRLVNEISLAEHMIG